jgi:hypothetical protein
LDDLVPFVPTSVDQRQPDQLPHDAFRKTALVGTGSAAQSPTPPDIKKSVISSYYMPYLLGTC